MIVIFSVNNNTEKALNQIFSIKYYTKLTFVR